MSKPNDESKTPSSAMTVTSNHPEPYNQVLDCHEQRQQSLTMLSNNGLQPFDWLTSAASLEPILCPILCGSISNRVLHVGCGSSILGELLIEDTRYNVSSVVNVDCDIETLERMQQRWQRKADQLRVTNTNLDEKAMEFVTADFTFPDSLRHYTENSSNISTFDVVLDKSTLDCMLCTDTGAVGLLLETYRCLKENGGVYLVISFHPSEFIRPLLEDLPGAHWDVQCTSIPRQMEQLNTIENNGTLNGTVTKLGNESDEASSESINNLYTWSSGTFQPDERYVKYVTVVTCRRRPRDAGNSISVINNELDWDQVYEHVHRVNNQWYQQTNPMLTKERVQTIERAFAASTRVNGSNNMELPLEQCYPILFTDGERENLSYEDFTDDWRSFLSKYSSYDLKSEQISSDRMSFETAIAFLHVMQ
jgi:SAM-dependent methyltransferase